MAKLSRSKETSCILLPRNAAARFIRYFSNILIRVSNFSGQNRTETSSIGRDARGKYVYARSWKNLRDGKRRYFVRGIIDISLQYLLQLCCTGAINLGKDWRSCNKVGSFHCSKAFEYRNVIDPPPPPPRGNLLLPLDNWWLLAVYIGL